ncbi:MAG: 50S ribosomal protein L23 [Bacteroidota bacterium]|nr:50S ribosomal protein L23 [Bacteroidota bacterium]
MSILIKPVITEKMTAATEKLNSYGFIVNKSSNKIEIKKEIEHFYGVSVDSINTINYLGKFKVRSTKAGMIPGRRNSYKKAIVTLKKGETIDFFSNI